MTLLEEMKAHGQLGWLDHVQSVHRDGIRSRLSSDDYAATVAAFWELYLHETHRRLGFSIEIEPALSHTPRSPDFRIVEGARRTFYVEATLVHPSRNKIGADRRARQLINGLKCVASPNFSLHVELEEIGERLPAVKRLCRQIDAWLASFDPSQRPQSRSQQTPLRWREDGWDIEIVAFARRTPREPGSPVVGTHGQGGYTDDKPAIINAIKEKGSRYGELGAPYVIALLPTRDFTTWDDVEDALFGTVRYLVPRDLSAELIPYREPKGALINWRSPQFKRVSAVLVALELHPATVNDTIPRLYANPWASHPIQLALPWPRYEIHLRTGAIRGPTREFDLTQLFRVNDQTAA